MERHSPRVRQDHTAIVCHHRCMTINDTIITNRKTDATGPAVSAGSARLGASRSGVGAPGRGLGLPLRALRNRRDPRHLPAGGRRTTTASMLDIACGSGLAVRIADGLGARTAGIDAAGELVDIARERTPNADLRVGDMFDLPWSDESFDSVISINGIWGGCEAALAESFRVLRPDGRLASASGVTVTSICGPASRCSRAMLPSPTSTG